MSENTKKKISVRFERPETFWTKYIVEVEVDSNLTDEQISKMVLNEELDLFDVIEEFKITDDFIDCGSVDKESIEIDI